MQARLVALLAAVAIPAAATAVWAQDAVPVGGEVVVPWPGGTPRSATEGRVQLQCVIDTHGLAETCRVASETPAGRNLARAAMGLRTTLKLAPPPANTVMAINVRFTTRAHEFENDKLQEAFARGRGGFGTLDIPPNDTPVSSGEEARIDLPIWTQTASFEDLAAAYPAKGGGVEGYVAAHCRIERDGDKAGLLRECGVAKETPEGAGFGKAALGLTAKFRILPAALASLPRGEPIWVYVPIRLPPPGGPEARTVSAPQWIVGLDPRTIQQAFPPEAAAKGVTTGRGVARCTVGADGMLSGCAADAAEPSGLGFSEAAVRLVSGMRMNLWSADGAPVRGGVVRIPVRLDKAGG